MDKPSINCGAGFRSHPLYGDIGISTVPQLRKTKPNTCQSKLCPTPFGFLNDNQMVSKSNIKKALVACEIKNKSQVVFYFSQMEKLMKNRTCSKPSNNLLQMKDITYRQHLACVAGKAMRLDLRRLVTW